MLLTILCEEVVHVRPADFFLIPDYFKTQEMCIRAVKACPWQLYSVLDWFVVLQEIWCEDFDNNDYLNRWHNAHQKQKAQRASIKVELMPIAWHPSRWWD